MNVEDKYYKGPTHEVIADCPDCGRVTIHKSRCGKCHGSSWLPAGYFNLREYRKQVRNKLLTGISS